MIFASATHLDCETSIFAKVRFQLCSLPTLFIGTEALNAPSSQSFCSFAHRLCWLIFCQFCGSFPFYLSWIQNLEGFLTFYFIFEYLHIHSWSRSRMTANGSQGWRLLCCRYRAIMWPLKSHSSKSRTKVQYITAHYSTVQYSTLQVTILYTVQYSTVHYNTVQYITGHHPHHLGRGHPPRRAPSSGL